MSKYNLTGKEDYYDIEELIDKTEDLDGVFDEFASANPKIKFCNDFSGEWGPEGSQAYVQDNKVVKYFEVVINGDNPCSEIEDFIFHHYFPSKGITFKEIEQRTGVKIGMGIVEGAFEIYSYATTKADVKKQMESFRDEMKKIGITVDRISYVEIPNNITHKQPAGRPFPYNLVATGPIDKDKVNKAFEEVKTNMPADMNPVKVSNLVDKAAVDFNDDEKDDLILKILEYVKDKMMRGLI